MHSSNSVLLAFCFAVYLVTYNVKVALTGGFDTASGNNDNEKVRLLLLWNKSRIFRSVVKQS